MTAGKTANRSAKPEYAEKSESQMMNFIELEKLRLDFTPQIDLDLPQTNTEVLVPPLLLIAFVENAFKHSLEEEENKAFITIDLGIQATYLTFKVENTIAKNPIAESSTNSFFHYFENKFNLIKDFSIVLLITMSNALLNVYKCII